MPDPEIRLRNRSYSIKLDGVLRRQCSAEVQDELLSCRDQDHWYFTVSQLHMVNQAVEQELAALRIVSPEGGSRTYHTMIMLNDFADHLGLLRRFSSQELNDAEYAQPSYGAVSESYTEDEYA